MSEDGPRSGPAPLSSGSEHDAWLREALRHAPDASASPPPSLRDAILAEARAAARTGRAPRTAASASLLDRALAFWSWLARPPVAVGFASVMVATLVGMLWWDRPMDETMLPPPSFPNAAMGPRSAPDPLPAASEQRSPPADADKANPRLADLAQVPAPPATAGTELRDTAPPAKTAPPRAAAETAATDAARKQKAARETTDERARSAANANLMAKTEEAKAARKDDKLEKAAPSPAAMAPAISAAAPATPSTLRSAAEAPTPSPTHSPADADATTRQPAPVAAPRLAAPPPPASPAPFAATPTPSPAATTPPAVAAAPPPMAPSLQQPPPAPAQGRAEPFSLAKKAESGEKEGAAAKARSAPAAPTAPAARTPAPAGALGAALDSSEASATGRVAAESAATAESRQRAASVAPSARPMAPLLAALASEEARWSRRLASGESAAVDAALRAWLAQVQSAAPRWEPASERSGRRDAPAASSPSVVLRLERDDRASAIVQIEDGGVLFDPLSGSAWFAPLAPDVVTRLRATLPPAPR